MSITLYHSKRKSAIYISRARTRRVFVWCRAPIRPRQTKSIRSGITLSIFALVQKYSHLLQEAKDRKNTLFVFLLGASRRFGAAQSHNPVSKTKNRPSRSAFCFGADYGESEAKTTECCFHRSDVSRCEKSERGRPREVFSTQKQTGENPQNSKSSWRGRRPCPHQNKKDTFWCRERITGRARRKQLSVVFTEAMSRVARKASEACLAKSFRHKSRRERTRRTRRVLGGVDAPCPHQNKKDTLACYP